MKYLTTIFAIIFFVFNSVSQEIISLNSGYQNQSYYSFLNGEQANVSGQNWDIAFTLESFNASIRVNGGHGVELYNYTNGDTSSWSSINSSSVSSLSTFLMNSDTGWSVGAFDVNQLGHPDYGWGVYNMGNHYVVGDSLFIIKTVNGIWKKLWIKELAASGIFTLMHADLDGSNLVVQSINKNDYSNKNFIYYSIEDNQIHDREPLRTDWDITFTKYLTFVQGQPYAVTGVLSNKGIKVAQANNIANPMTYTDFSSHAFSSEINIIGYDWKTFNMSSFSYDIANDVCYFVQDFYQNIWKIVFTGFDGSSTGDIYFNTELVSSVNSLNFIEENSSFAIYPNPATNNLNIIYDELKKTILTIYDVSGRLLLKKELNNKGFSSQSIDISSFDKGVYLVQINQNGIIKSERLIIE